MFILILVICGLAVGWMLGNIFPWFIAVPLALYIGWNLPEILQTLFPHLK